MVNYNQQHTELSEQDKRLENALKERAEQLQKTAEVKVEEKLAFVSCMNDHVKTAMEEPVKGQSQAAKHDGTDTEAEYRSLHVDQKKIVDKVFSAVCDRTEPLHLIIGGPRGTANSKVISLLY